MKNNTPTSNKQNESKAEVIKLGVDIHKNYYVAVRQIDGGPLQPAQRFTPEKYLAWVEKQLQMAERVVTCYEAGCFGYSLHRRLRKMGAENYVVRPRDWDEYGTRVKTDKRDARELCSNLDRYVAGNKGAICVVRVPTEEEERRRAWSRQRDMLAKEKKRLQNQGTSAARFHGQEIPSNWWKPKTLERLKSVLPDYLYELLLPIQTLLLTLVEELKKAVAREEKKAARELPVGMGALSASIVDQEIGDYNRFNNRRQVASFFGFCPREDSSGKRRFQGSINKSGNPRLRHVLIETVWRLMYFQPDYKPYVKWKQRMVSEPFTAARKKKMVVALARHFIIDWWRIQTGRAKPEDLGLRMGLPSSHNLKDWRESQKEQAAA